MTYSVLPVIVAADRDTHSVAWHRLNPSFVIPDRKIGTSSI